MKKVALITGITGMIGTHFAAQLQQQGWQTYGIARSSAASRIAAIDYPNIYRADILDTGALARIFKKVEPTLVVHLAAQAFNGTSWEMEEQTHMTNYMGTYNILRACRDYAPQAQVMLACSSTEYGKFEEKDCPLKETMRLQPITPYGVSKLATEALGFQFFQNYQIPVYLPRLFIHVGTGHPPATAIQNFARQLALIKKKKIEPVLRVGNLSSARDFIDVRDGVSAMITLLEKGTAGEAVNICTGTAHSIQFVLDTLIKIADVDVKVTQDSHLLRPTDEPLLQGDATKIKKLGWKQRYTIEQTLQAVFEDWMSRA